MASSAGGRGSSSSSDGKLTFVVTTNPFDASSAANKKQVRSIAALKSWPERRKRTFEQFEETSSSGRTGQASEKTSPASSTKPRKARRRTTTESTSPRPTVKAKRPRHLSPVPQSADGPIPMDAFSEPPLFEKCTRSIDENCDCSHCRFERTVYIRSWRKASSCNTEPTRGRRRSTHDGTLSSPSTVTDAQVLTPPTSPIPPILARARANSAGPAEPFTFYPVPRRPWFDRILHHNASDDEIGPSGNAD